MDTRIFVTSVSLFLLPALGCAQKASDDPAMGDGENMDDGGGDAPGSSGDDGPGSGDAASDGSDDGPAEEGASEGNDDDAGSDEGCNFLCPGDAGPDGIFECDLWAQDCPEGEKCVPWAADGGTWNATRCAEIADNPAQPGDECFAEGGGANGDDTCALGSMCWDVDPETSMGTCIAQCTGDPDNGICEDSDTTCSITNNGALQLCLPICNPLLQDCSAEGQACYPVNDAFACAPDVSAEDAAAGSPCAFINVCPPGLICLTPEAYGPDCESGDGCCVAVCDVTDAAVSCPGSGQSCEAWYEEGEAPPGYTDVGACVVPA